MQRWWPIIRGGFYGTIATLTHAELDRLYSEPSVAAYRPGPVLARLADGTAELALCFNLPTIPDDRTTDPGYVADLRAIARKVGLPGSYVASIGKDEPALARTNKGYDGTSRRGLRQRQSRPDTSR